MYHCGISYTDDFYFPYLIKKGGSGSTSHFSNFLPLYKHTSSRCTAETPGGTVVRYKITEGLKTVKLFITLDVGHNLKGMKLKRRVSSSQTPPKQQTTSCDKELQYKLVLILWRTSSMRYQTKSVKPASIQK